MRAGPYGKPRLKVISGTVAAALLGAMAAAIIIDFSCTVLEGAAQSIEVLSMGSTDCIFGPRSVA